MFWSRLLAAKSNRKVLFSEVRRAGVEAGRSLRDPVLGWGWGGRGEQGPWDQTHALMLALALTSSVAFEQVT